MSEEQEKRKLEDSITTEESETKKRKIEEDKSQEEENIVYDEFGDQDVVVCHCGIDAEDGLMIQCEKCTFWQHCICVEGLENATSEDIEKIEKYVCDACKAESELRKKKKRKKKKVEEDDFNPEDDEAYNDENEEEEEEEEVDDDDY
eukprot:gene180-4426_t